MFIRASACTRADLEHAFADYAEAHTHARAADALERATGARDVQSVPEHRIVNGLAELICGFSFVGRSAPSKSQAIADSIARVHAALAAIREKAFAGR
jgi:hypothetical protein